MSYFAAALARGADGWTGRELDLDDVGDIDMVADTLRDMLAEDEGPALLFLEENDEYFIVLRVDSGDTDEARSFISDVRSVETSELAAVLYEETASDVLVVDDEPEDGDDSSTVRPEGEPGGDDTIVSDLGTKPAELRELCAEEGLLPSDIIYTLCERAGCADVIEELRGA